MVWIDGLMRSLMNEQHDQAQRRTALRREVAAQVDSSKRRPSTIDHCRRFLSVLVPWVASCIYFLPLLMRHLTVTETAIMKAPCPAVIAVAEGIGELDYYSRDLPVVVSTGDVMLMRQCTLQIKEIPTHPPSTPSQLRFITGLMTKRIQTILTCM